MKQLDLVEKFIKEKCLFGRSVEDIKKDNMPGISANNIQEEMGILRANASSILNNLCKEGKLIKINSRPVTFLPYDIIHRIHEKYNLSLKTCYTLSELKESMLHEQIEKDDPFAKLLGYNSSLLYQIRQAKAAIVYPPKGLHTILLGESGVGKTTFAQAMHAYGLLAANKNQVEYPFITFNCADYFNNPQLLLSQLFGHVKNAFTGADKDKIGLVEEADGGILFLDEVHRLPPDGQEMLFYLMDKGEYKRLGDSIKRKSNILIIAATTENPTGVLLNTFMRRVPVNIILPTYKEKPIAEKIEIIEQFFRFEAINLKQIICIAPEVLKALALYQFAGGNIGQLRSEIKLLCANAFLQYLQNKQPITIGFQMLSKDIRDVLFNYAKIDKTITRYLDMFSEEIEILPQKDTDIISDGIKNDIYEIISNKLNYMREQGIAGENITDSLKNEIDTYLSSVNKYFSELHSNIANLYKLVSKEIIDVTMQFITYAREELRTDFNNYFLFALSLHIQSLIKRIDKKQLKDNRHLFKIKTEHPAEFKVADKLVEILSDKFGVIIPESEKGFLALLFYRSQIEIDNSKIGMIIICHGESTATSMADACNRLLNTELVKAIDMPLNQGIDDTYQQVKSMALTINKGKGIILLVDMGSLLSFDKRLTADTGIKSKMIKAVSTPVTLDILRHVLYDVDDIDKIYAENNNYINEEYETAIKRKPLAILSVCATGEGSSKIIKDMLDVFLQKHYKTPIEVIAVDYIKAKDLYKSMCKEFCIIAIVGNMDPKLSVPFFTISKLMQNKGKEILLHLIEGNAGDMLSIAELPESATIYETAKEVLEKYVKYVNPRHAIFVIRSFVEEIGYASKDKNMVLDLIMHMGCLLDRCIGQINIKYDNLQDFYMLHKELFISVRNAIKPLEEDYNIKISDDEIAYVVKILVTRV